MWLLAVLVLSPSSFLHMIAASSSKGPREGAQWRAAQLRQWMWAASGSGRTKGWVTTGTMHSASSKPQTPQTAACAQGCSVPACTGLFTWLQQNTPRVAGNSVLERRLQPSERHFCSLSASLSNTLMRIKEQCYCGKTCTGPVLVLVSSSPTQQMLSQHKCHKLSLNHWY